MKLCGRRGGELLVVDRTNLLICGSVPLHPRDAAASVIFSDGDFLGTISSAKDVYLKHFEISLYHNEYFETQDGFVVRLLNQNVSPASLVNELPLKLARKCIEALGSAPFEEEVNSNSIAISSEEEIVSVCAGKEFGLVRTVSGKVFYTGKASSLGIKQAGVRTGKWSELVLNKSPKINHIAMGHDGFHAILIVDDGAVLFTGKMLFLITSRELQTFFW